MTKSILKYLLTIPDKHMRAWIHILAHMDDLGVFTCQTDVFTHLICGCNQTACMKMIHKGLEHFKTCPDIQSALVVCTDDSFTLTILTADKKPRKKAASKPKQDQSIFKKCVELYNNFCKDQMGVSAMMNGLQGKAMKTIISYLSKQWREQVPGIIPEQVNEKVIQDWAMILFNWAELPEFYRAQIKLNQISSNLPNIINHYKNGDKKQQAFRYNKFNNAIAAAGSIDFDQA